VSRPLRVAVVVSVRSGYAARFVERATRDGTPGAELVAVVFQHGTAHPPAARRRMLWRKVRKAARIGLIGTLNGVLMRRWYRHDLAERLGARDIFDVCREAGVPLLEISRFGDPAAQRAVRDLDLDVGLSMGNGYIPRSFFTIPRMGMLNIHHEVLPEYKGAQTAVWQIHNGSRSSGFTIHEINDRIDDGPILYREVVPLCLRATLRETVVETSAHVQERSIDAARDVLADLATYRDRAIPNVGGTGYTTPNTMAVIRIHRNFRRLLRSADGTPA
jgi:methionyl-tRNA formyltransferase